MDKKMTAIQDMDECLDDEIIDIIEKFKANPSPQLLDMYTKVMKADHYTDAWLEKYAGHGRTATAPGAMR